MPINRSDVTKYQKVFAQMLDDVGITLTPDERANIEIAELGLGNFESEGLGLVVYVNTDRYCAKELMMLPGQTCPQHRHPPVGDDPGKRETFRCRSGEVYLYVEGDRSGTPSGHPIGTLLAPLQRPRPIPPTRGCPPDTPCANPPNSWHWFQAGPEGCVVSEFSSTSRDKFDVFADPGIKRIPEIVEDA